MLCSEDLGLVLGVLWYETRRWKGAGVGVVL